MGVAAGRETLYELATMTQMTEQLQKQQAAAQLQQQQQQGRHHQQQQQQMQADEADGEAMVFRPSDAAVQVKFL